MNEFTESAAMVVAAFLLGSIPFGLLISKLYGINDLREQGSGNIGATNVSRVVGFWPAGFLTFFLDALKGILILLPLRYRWIPEGTLPASTLLLWTLGLSAVVGHCFSPWLHFKGGKGVATTFGVIFALAPLSGVVGGIVFGLAAFATQVGAAGSLLGLLAAIAVYRLFYPFEPSMLIFALMVYLAIFRHEENLDSLLKEDARESA
ncbi:MAG: glycerol-3-phosphate acyltransferase [Cryobacterium sp.]|nr:glycerol-3-phosphate acyltransferase [Oligoflexia bacterium]